MSRIELDAICMKYAVKQWPTCFCQAEVMPLKPVSCLYVLSADIHYRGIDREAWREKNESFGITASTLTAFPVCRSICLHLMEKSAHTHTCTHLFTHIPQVSLKHFRRFRQSVLSFPVAFIRLSEV